MNPARLGRHDSWDGVRAVVAGFGVSGFAAADNLLHLGATVTALDEKAEGDGRAAKAELLEVLGATIRLGAGTTATLPDDVDLLVTSPGWRPDAPLLAQARARGVPIWGEVELAWRLRDPNHDTQWLAVTGTNGKTTTVQMLDAILRAAGLRSVAAGNVGLPLVEAVMDPEPYDVLAVELSSFQLHYTDSMSAEAAAVLNVAQDHLDWYTLRSSRCRSTQPTRAASTSACSAPASTTSPTRSPRSWSARPRWSRAPARSVSRSGMPAVGMVGLVEDILADRAFIEERESSAAELCTLADLAAPGTPGPAPHTVQNALAAAALARAHGVSQAAVREGLRGFRPDGHRIALVAELDGVAWVDDSKATNPHAALASLLAYDPVVWVAGGLAKGASFDDLVRTVAGRLRGAVLLGRDRDVIAEALARHAPDVPVILVDTRETSGTEGDHASGVATPMRRVVTAAAGLARPGDTVLLAPGCASQDMFIDYAARGDAFAAAVQELTG